MLKTPLCNQFGIDYPILCVGMGTISGAGLAAAVSNAGALGVIGVAGMPATYTRNEIERLQSRTSKPFAVNIILALLQEGQLEACFDAHVPIIVFFWGDPAPYVSEAHRRGIKVLVQVGSVDEASRAAAAGVDGIIAQGVEAGGHVKSAISLSTLLPSVVDAVRPVPVIAAGGIGNGRGIVMALSLGAHGVSMGTRFLCSKEARAASEYKDRVVRSQAEDTALTPIFDGEWPNAPHRVLRNKAVTEWEAAGRPAPGQRPGEGSVVGNGSRAGWGSDQREAIFHSLADSRLRWRS
jgi:NAD(P)H-dependent flavin oxidoreductase YrpB (nitropropane dioxygenase family)